jgi:cobalt-zinc-cadmium efflux system protein
VSHVHRESSASRHGGRLRAALGLTGAFMLLEVVAGWATGSLALLADAGHMLTDVGGLALALFAIHMGERPATPQRTYGYYRVEILAALANALVLLLDSGFVLYEAYQRFRQPPSVASGPMLAVAAIGLFVNAGGILLLRGASAESLNLKGAYFEVLSDAISSVGVIAAAAVMWTTGWYYADPLVSAGIGLFIVPRTVRLMGDAVSVLLEGTPADVNLAELREALARLEGVQDVHDLHVWALTSGVNAISAHLVADVGSGVGDLLARARHCATHEFRIAHVTIQIEPPGWHCEGPHL